uniref:SUMF1/EgtB/PvdO family nonheme iron enzyme n=1 Tax=Roseihalotalea indica TaxID=2867963 RepID=A0AA49GHY1_9BACT|nr:SUMF1/EgtB/PvdO family nonheme iron enzyme [Tunicatimonas sp. TK19036]
MKTKLPILLSLQAFLFFAFTEKDDFSTLLKSRFTQNYVSISAGEVMIQGAKSNVEAFAISRYEITNQQYNDFLQTLDDKTRYQARINNEGWLQAFSEDWGLEKSYHTQKAWADNPVVNITREGAELYCQWLTEQYKKENTNDWEVVFRLPTHQEWVRAARGDNHHDKYAWNSPYIETADGRYRCNFRRLGEEQIHFNASTNTYEVIRGKVKRAVPTTVNVDDFSPNNFGLYNVCGNVAEMIYRENIAAGGSWNDPGFDVQVESVRPTTGASPYVGFRPVMIATRK